MQHREMLPGDLIMVDISSATVYRDAPDMSFITHPVRLGGVKVTTVGIVLGTTQSDTARGIHGKPVMVLFQNDLIGWIMSYCLTKLR